MGSHEGTILFLEYNLTDEASQSNFIDQFNVLNLQEIFNIEEDTHKESVLVRAGGRATPKLEDHTDPRLHQPG